MAKSRPKSTKVFEEAILIQGSEFASDECVITWQSCDSMFIGSGRTSKKMASGGCWKIDFEKRQNNEVRL